MDFEEKRHLFRLQVAIPCQFQGPRSTHDGRILNLSLDGAFITSGIAPHPGAMVDVSFETDEGLHFRASCKVVHRGFFENTPDSQEGFGISFETFQGESRHWLENFVAAYKE